MSKLNGKEIENAVLHNAIFIIGVGSLGPNLSAKQTPSSSKVEMVIDEPFVMVRAQEKRGSKVHTRAVPLTNFLTLELKDN